MSKSKRNVVDPEDIIASYGADTARWFMLSDSPPERDVEWTEAGAEGVYRFVQRVWRLMASSRQPLANVTPATGMDGQAGDISRATHKTVKAVTEDIEKLTFNKAVARLHELVNHLAKATEQCSQGTLDDAEQKALANALDTLCILISPMMPHLAEECWAERGHETLVATQPWPDYDRALVAEDSVTLPVQINGKKRGELVISKLAGKDEIENAVLQLDTIVPYLEGGAPKRIIVVPNRIVNLVI